MLMQGVWLKEKTKPHLSTKTMGEGDHLGTTLRDGESEGKMIRGALGKGEGRESFPKLNCKRSYTSGEKGTERTVGSDATSKKYRTERAETPPNTRQRDENGSARRNGPRFRYRETSGGLLKDEGRK